jgi:uroporphyrinogen decarboxylase
MQPTQWPWKPQPDFTLLRDAIYRKGDPKNIRVLELFADDEFIYNFMGESPTPRQWSRHEWIDWYLNLKTQFWYQLGYDAFWQDVILPFPQTTLSSTDTADLKKKERVWVDEKAGIITSWKDFETYPWPEPKNADNYPMDYLAKNLPEGMAVLARAGGVLEQVMWLIGYEPFAVWIYDNPDLIQAMFDKVESIFLPLAETVMQMDHVMGLLMGDDMGFRSGTMIAPKHLRKYVFPIQKKVAAIAHRYGKPFMLHSCGNLESVMEDLIDDVGIDSKHSFEDAILPVEEFSKRYNHRISVIGGVDVDLLCRGTEEDIRKRTRAILEACAPSRGYILGTGNSVPNYIPMQNFLTLLDEGQRFNHGL